MRSDQPAPPIAACIDIGGTKALLGFVTREGTVLATEKITVFTGYEPANLVGWLAACMRRLADKSDLKWERVRGVGYSTAGMMDVERGVIFASPNQGDWRDIPFQELLEQAFLLPARIEMDANAAALGEAWLGAGKDGDPLVYLVVGTGIGAGMLVHGQVVRGWRGTAGEVGHMVIEPDGPPCNCGRYGCLESLASGPAIALRARQMVQRGRAGRLQELAEGDIKAETVFQAARAGDPDAMEIVKITVRYLSIGVTNLIHIINPRAIIIGGGVGLGGADLLLAPLKQEVSRRVGSWIDMERTLLTTSTLGNYAGLLGAAWLVWNHLDKDSTR